MTHRSILAACLAAVLGACTSLDPEYLKAATRPTPAVWTAPATWQFTLTSKDGEPRGTLAFEFTDEQVPACASGRWRHALYRGGTATYPPLAAWYRDGDKYAAYLITGQALVVLLNVPDCGEDFELRGTISDQGGSGTFNWVGTVTAESMGGFTAARAP